MSTPATIIQNYLLMHLSKEIPGLDIWRANVVAARAGKHFVRAGEPGQADLTGVWGGRCRSCGRRINAAKKNHEFEGIEAIIGGACEHPIIPIGRSIWLEVKALGDVMQPNQLDFERRVSRLGALYIVCRVKRKETISDLAERHVPKPRITAPPGEHPAEIQDFINELRSNL